MDRKGAIEVSLGLVLLILFFVVVVGFIVIKGWPVIKNLLGLVGG